MSPCIFCLMLRKKQIRLREALTVSLMKDSQGTAYFQVEVPRCQAHGGMPGILDQVMADEPPEDGSSLYDGSVKLFVPGPSYLLRSKEDGRYFGHTESSSHTWVNDAEDAHRLTHKQAEEELIANPDCEILPAP